MNASPQAIERAKAKKLHLVNIEIDGQYCKSSKQKARVCMTGAVSPRLARRIRRLLLYWCEHPDAL